MTASVQTGYEPGHFPARWWRPGADGRIECTLCPRGCRLRDGQRGFCFVRRRCGDRMELASYGRTAGFQIDPIEKKPLNHFLPGTSILSFGSVGCNLGCRFCQNWHTSKADNLDLLGSAATPREIAIRARHCRCHTVAFTYNDPVIFAEFALDVARVCRAEGLRTVAVTAGYINPAARSEFFAAMDAANVDLKAFTDDFYRRICIGRLQPVLDTLRYLHRETAVWLEVTTLLIPGLNDSADEIDRASDWFVAELGCDVPWHFSAYHPAFKLTTAPTPPETLQLARDIARSKGLRYVYTGNIRDRVGSSTWCSTCGALLIQREGFEIIRYRLVGSRCPECWGEIPGRFDLDRAGPVHR